MSFWTKLSEAWKKHGTLITAVGSVGAMLVVVGMSYGKLHSKVESIELKQAELGEALGDLRKGPLKDLDSRLDDLQSSLNVLAKDPSASVTINRLAAVEESVAGIRDEAMSVRATISDLQARSANLRRLEGSYESLLAGYGKIRQESLQEHREIQRDIGKLRVDIEKMNVLLELIKPLISEGLAIGRISLEDVRKIYSEEDVRAFLKEAEELLQKPRGSGGNGGGGGGYAIAHGSWDYGSSECGGIPQDCLSISFRGESGVRNTLELFYGLSHEEMLALIDADAAQEERLASARNYPGRLCEWVGISLTRGEEGLQVSGEEDRIGDRADITDGRALPPSNIRADLLQQQVMWSTGSHLSQTATRHHPSWLRFRAVVNEQFLSSNERSRSVESG